MGTSTDYLHGMQVNNSPCGCCWSFATTAAVECVNALVSGENLALSKQQLIDCDHTGALPCPACPVLSCAVLWGACPVPFCEQFVSAVLMWCEIDFVCGRCLRSVCPPFLCTKHGKGGPWPLCWLQGLSGVSLWGLSGVRQAIKNLLQGLRTSCEPSLDDLDSPSWPSPVEEAFSNDLGSGRA